MKNFDFKLLLLSLIAFLIPCKLYAPLVFPKGSGSEVRKQQPPQPPLSRIKGNPPSTLEKDEPQRQITEDMSQEKPRDLEAEQQAAAAQAKRMAMMNRIAAGHGMGFNQAAEAIGNVGETPSAKPLQELPMVNYQQPSERPKVPSNARPYTYEAPKPIVLGGRVNRLATVGSGIKKTKGSLFNKKELPPIDAIEKRFSKQVEKENPNAKYFLDAGIPLPKSNTYDSSRLNMLAQQRAPYYPAEQINVPPGTPVNRRGSVDDGWEGEDGQTTPRLQEELGSFDPETFDFKAFRDLKPPSLDD